MVKAEKFSEAELIERILGGEQALYEIIVRRFNPYLYKVGRSYNFSHDDTLDLMQDTFVDAYKGLANFENRSSFKTWIIRIMLNNCYKMSQKSRYKNEVMQDYNESSVPMFSDRSNDTGFVIQKMEMGNVIENALNSIPSEYRMVFSLREINGFDTAETASLLDISEANVKVRLNRAKSMLRSQLENEYSPGELFSFNLIFCDRIVENVMERIKDISF